MDKECFRKYEGADKVMLRRSSMITPGDIALARLSLAIAGRVVCGTAGMGAQWPRVEKTF